MPNSRTRKSDKPAVRAIIQARAARLFSSRGYGSVSVGDIMGELGRTHGAFYHYFRSKQQLLSAILRDQAAEISAIKSLRALTENLLARAGARGEGWVLASVLQEVEQLPEDLTELVATQLARHARRLDELQAGGFGPPGLEIMMTQIGAFQIMRAAPRMAYDVSTVLTESAKPMAGERAVEDVQRMTVKR